MNEMLTYKFAQSQFYNTSMKENFLRQTKLKAIK